MLAKDNSKLPGACPFHIAGAHEEGSQELPLLQWH
jgi:hypothetical protein